MKRMKKIMALMLVAIMMMAMSVTAFAAEGATSVAAGANTLTVNVKTTTAAAQDLKGQTINLYKLFDVTESGATGSKNYAYTVNTASGYKDALVSVLGSPITASSTDEQFAAAVYPDLPVLHRFHHCRTCPGDAGRLAGGRPGARQLYGLQPPGARLWRRAGICRRRLAV